MAFDFKKEYKEFYMPKNKPQIVTIPKANYIAVRGKGNPNEEGGEYKTAIGVLYAVAYTLKMSYKTDYKIDGFFEYVVPPLEGFWWQDNVESVDYTNKSAFNWISVIRLPDFIAKKDFDWAVETASKKKKMDCSGAEFLSIDEGLCVQIMHSLDIMDAIIEGYDVLKKAGYEILPKGEYETCVNKKKFCAWMYRFMFSNFIGKLCISDHAMSAREEFMMLESEFEKLKNETGIETEAYDKLKVDFLHYTR